jgi:hypothetical protein
LAKDTGRDIEAKARPTFSKITRDRIEAVDRELMKEQHPDMPINIDRQSRVTFGGSRKK